MLYKRQRQNQTDGKTFICIFAGTETIET